MVLVLGALDSCGKMVVYKNFVAILVHQICQLVGCLMCGGKVCGDPLNPAVTKSIEDWHFADGLAAANHMPTDFNGK
jgi:hypothetical protein